MPRNFMKVGGLDVELKYFRAHLLLNEEGLLDTPKQLRILLADREVPDTAIYGMVFPEVRQMAMGGIVQGLLLEFDPDDLGKLGVTVLVKPANPQTMLITQSLASSAKDLIRKFRMAAGIVSGEIECHPDGDSSGSNLPALEYSVAFKAQIVNEPAVTEDLKGAAAKKSAPVAALRKKIEAMVKGDAKALELLSTEAANRRNAPFLAQPEALGMMKQAGAEMQKSLKGIERVVVRGGRATVIFKGKQWMTFLKQGGVWRSDN